MRTKFILLLVFSLSMIRLTAQSTQQGALLQQIAALRVYGEYVQKGYSVVKKGLNVISDFKSGEFGLHSDYFESLGLPNLVVRDSETIIRILSLQEKIIRESARLQEDSIISQLSQDETAYCQRVKSRLLEGCWKELEFLYDVLTDKSLQMGDEERLGSIAGIYQEMSSNYAFIKKFTADTVLLVKEREREVRSSKKSKQLFNIN